MLRFCGWLSGGAASGAVADPGGAHIGVVPAQAFGKAAHMHSERARRSSALPVRVSRLSVI